MCIVHVRTQVVSGSGSSVVVLQEFVEGAEGGLLLGVDPADAANAAAATAAVAPGVTKLAGNKDKKLLQKCNECKCWVRAKIASSVRGIGFSYITVWILGWRQQMQLVST